MTYQLLTDNALEVLQTLSTNSINLCVCSPPYFNQRRYKARLDKFADTLQPSLLGIT